MASETSTVLWGPKPRFKDKWRHAMSQLPSSASGQMRWEDKARGIPAANCIDMHREFVINDLTIDEIARAVKRIRRSLEIR